MLNCGWYCYPLGIWDCGGCFGYQIDQSEFPGANVLQRIILHKEECAILCDINVPAEGHGEREANGAVFHRCSPVTSEHLEVEDL